MKLKRLTMVFAKPLTEVIQYQGQQVTQEEILLCDINGIKVKIKKELDKVLRGVNMVRLINPAMFDMFKLHIQRLEHNFEWLVSFKKIDDTHYEFIYPYDSNAIFTIKELSSKLGPLKKYALGRLKNDDIQVIQILRETQLRKAFENYSFKEMKLKPGEYSLSNN
jgi:hypothetical protein